MDYNSVGIKTVLPLRIRPTKARIIEWIMHDPWLQAVAYSQASGLSEYEIICTTMDLSWSRL